MSSTATIEARPESRLRDRRKAVGGAVPLLLSAFPVPPSHLPPSPYAPPTPSPGFNLPPSLPPSTPLPPVPGPSPISEHDTLMFISAARSHRASKLSLASSSNRDSIATVASFASSTSAGPPSLSPSISLTPLDSTQSLRSYSSNGSLFVPSPPRMFEKPQMFAPRINEEDMNDISRRSPDEISQNLQTIEHTDDEKVLEMIIPPSFTRRHAANDSISSIDLRDLPSLNEDTSDITPPTSAPAVLRTPRSSAASHHAPHRPSIEKALPPIPRAESPDIAVILASTPRPRRKSAASLRDRSSSRSQPMMRRRVSEGTSLIGSSSASRRTSASSRATGETRSGSPSELPYSKPAVGSWQDDSFVSDYGVPLDRTGTAIEIFDEEEEERLERELEGGGSDTDSSLDIHTPLPNLMLRDGLLSPNSKLLPQSSRASSPFGNGRPGSIMSVASTTASIMTKSGIYKDQRDTVKRRVRHRDGKLLRGGIGLTTGLGWSDSEDEGAPSPLTRRLSSITLHSKVSNTSLRSHALAQSFNESALNSLPSDDLPSAKPYGNKPLRSAAPPTSWNKQSVGTDKRTSTSSTVSSTSSTSAFGLKSRPSMSSLRSVSSSSRLVNPSSSASLGYIKERDESDFLSSSSNASIPMPVTPVGNEFSPSVAAFQKSLNSSSSSRPFPSSATTTPRTPVPRPLRLPQSIRTPSSHDRSSNISTSSSTPSVSEQGPPRMRTISAGALPRPRVSSSSKVARPPMPHTAAAALAGAAVPQRSASLGSPSAQAKQKPRTGTGMTYRTTAASSSSLSGRQSLMRPPSGPALKMARSEAGLAR